MSYARAAQLNGKKIKKDFNKSSKNVFSDSKNSNKKNYNVNEKKIEKNLNGCRNRSIKPAKTYFNAKKTKKSTSNMQNKRLKTDKSNISGQSQKINEYDIDLSKMTRKERKEALIAKTKKLNENKLTKKKQKKETTDTESYIFVIRHGKISKKMKSQINALKHLFQPNTNLKFEETNVFDANIYKNIAQTYNISTFFILKEEKNGGLLKLYDVANKKSTIYKIIEFENSGMNKKYKTKGLFVYNGFRNETRKNSSISDDKVSKINYFQQTIGKNTFKTPDEIERIISFNVIDDLIYLRHYEIIKNENKCVKVGMKESGFKVCLKFLKSKEGQLDEKW